MLSNYHINKYTTYRYIIFIIFNCIFIFFKRSYKTDIISTKYGFYNYINQQDNKKVLFLDFGETHISCFITSFEKNKYTIENYEYDISIGGIFIDMVITQHIENIVKESLNIKELDFKTRLKIIKESEKIKKNLNLNQDTFFKKECFYQDEDINIEIKKEKFINLISKIKSQIELFLDSFININKIDIEKIDCIEILGGSSRLNFFREIIKKKFLKDINTPLKHKALCLRVKLRSFLVGRRPQRCCSSNLGF
jgi:molecular chaperone DnaK (HSP70)